MIKKRGKEVLSESKDYLFFRGDASEVKDCVTHAAESCVDADAGLFSDLFKREVEIVSHFEHLLLRLRELVDESLYIRCDLLGDDKVFDGCFAEFFAIEDIDVVDVGALQVFGFLLTIIIDDEVVGYTRNPSEELSVFGVSALLNSKDSFNESLLENIVGDVFVFYNTNDVIKDSVFMSFEKGVKCFVVSRRVSFDQKIIGHACKFCHC